MCNLASLALSRFVRPEATAVPAPWLCNANMPDTELPRDGLYEADLTGCPEPFNVDAVFDLDALRQVTQVVARSLDNVISVTSYTLRQARAGAI